MKYRSGQEGVTMLEMLVVIAIAAIFATISVPSMADYVRNTRLSSARMQLINDLNLARSEAIKRNARVLVCSGTAAGCAGSADWAKTGWAVCYDADRNAVCDVDTTGTNPNPFLVRGVLNVQISLVGPAAPVVYNPIGSQGIPGAAPIAFTLQGTWKNAKPMQTLNIAPTGNVTTY